MYFDNDCIVIFPTSVESMQEPSRSTGSASVTIEKQCSKAGLTPTILRDVDYHVLLNFNAPSSQRSSTPDGQ